MKTDRSIDTTANLSRRSFLRLAALGLGSLALPALTRPLAVLAETHNATSTAGLASFPASQLLARVAQGVAEIKARPDLNSETLGVLYEDAVLPWLHEVPGAQPAYIFNNQKWVETPEGYLYAPLIQPVRNLPNQPVSSLRQTSLGPGMWAEVTVPYVDTSLVNQPSSNSWVAERIEEGLPVRLHYGQVFWIDSIKTTDQGQVLYRVNPNYYGGLDLLWAAAEAFRPIQDDELSPIHPDAPDKRVEVDLTYQTLSCYEGQREVYFCRVSTGAKFDAYGNLVDKWATPVGEHTISRKFISLQMSGGTTGAGYDLPGIGWVTIFATGGVALHSTIWHNNFGDAMSHGCVNMLPEDAKWVFRWTLPNVPYDPGMLDSTLTGQASSKVNVVEQ